MNLKRLREDLLFEVCYGRKNPGWFWGLTGWVLDAVEQVAESMARHVELLALARKQP